MSAASQWTPVDETAAKWTPVEEPAQPKAEEGGLVHGMKAFGSDLWQSAKGVGGLFKPPRDATEKAIMLSSPGALQIYRLGKGYVSAVQQAHNQARASGEQGDVAGVLFNSAAAGLPLVGPLLNGVYEKSKSGDTSGAVGTGASRVLQAASMAPEGSAIPNPAAAAMMPATAVINRLRGAAPGLYRSALKPSPAMDAAQSARAVQTGLQQGISVSERGVGKLSDLINRADEAIADEIAARPGRTINPSAVATRADQIKPTFGNQVNAGQDLAALEAAKQQFLREQGAKPGTPAGAPQATGLVDAQGRPIMSAGTPAVPPKAAPPMDAARAQAMKQGTYTQLGTKSYGELQTASKEAQKALARGIKEELETQFPELHQLNSNLGDFYSLEPLLERAVNRIGNHQIMGIGTPIAAGGLKAVTGSAPIAAVGGVIRAVLDNPAFKSRLAIALGRASNVPPPVALARIGAYATALSQHESSDNPGQSPSQ